MSAAADRWLIVTQEGPEIYKVYKNATEAEARKQASKFWCCWVLFDQATPGNLMELACGGVGPTFLIHPAIRTYAEDNFRNAARDTDARKAAAAAAEARAAAAAKCAPAPSAKPKAPLSDGKPDVSNPVVWD
eukprot:62659-Prymnesium_polylepis.2